MKRILILEEGDILYNKKYNGFHQLREFKGSTVILSGCCSFLSDSKIVITECEVPIEFLDKLKPVYKKNHKFMKWNSSIEGFVADITNICGCIYIGSISRLRRNNKDR